MVDGRGIGQEDGIVHVDLLAGLHEDVVDHRRIGGDDVHVVLPAEPLLDDLHVEQPQEAAAEAEAQRGGTFGLVLEGSVVELELRHAGLELVVVRRVDGVDAAEDHGGGFPEPGQGLRAGGRRIGEGVTDLGIGGALQVRDHVAHGARGQFLVRVHGGVEVAHLPEFAFDAVAEEPDPRAPFEGAGTDPDVVHYAPEGVVVGVEDQRRGPVGRFGELRRRDPVDDRLEQLLYALAGLAGNAQRLLTGQGEDLFHLLVAQFQIGGGQVDLVHHRDHQQVLFEGQFHVGYGLGLDSLGGVDEEDRPFAGPEGAGDFVGKVHMSGGVDEVEFIGFAVARIVLHPDRVGLDGDAPLPFQIHAVQQLVLQVPRGHRAGDLEKPVRQGGLAVVDMGDDAEISD